MYDIAVEPMSREFFECWRAAAAHLDEQMKANDAVWLRAHPYPPILEHLSFRVGNQLFFVRVEDVDEKVDGPGTVLGLRSVAKGNSGHACILQMKSVEGAWVPRMPGWGLADANSGEAIDPETLQTDELIEMTDWEVQDFAVQIVRDHLSEKGYQLMSWQSNPKVDPSIWFVGESKGPEWVVVRGVRFPEKEARRPGNWAELVTNFSRMSPIGHFASVSVVSAEQPFSGDDEDPVRLYRGSGMFVRFTGLER